MKNWIALIITVGLLILLAGCSEKNIGCEELLVKLVSLTEDKDCGYFYFGLSAEDEAGYISEEEKAALYGERSVKECFPVLEDYGIFTLCAGVGEIGVFKCYSYSDTDRIANMCFERRDDIKVALRGSEWEKKTEKIRVEIHGKYVLFSFTDLPDKTVQRFRELT